MLATAVLERPPDPSAPRGPLDSYWRILLGALDGVSALSPPLVALPGFFHGTDVVTVIDGRPSELTALGTPGRYLPWRTWDDPKSDARDGIGFFDFKEAIDAGMPRVFLLPGAGEDRDAKVVTLNRAFSSDKPPLTLLLDREAPELIGVDEGAVRLVSWIQEKAVVVETPRKPKRDRLSLEPQERLPISGPEGVLVMRAALEDVIAERDLDAIKWRNAAG